MWQSGHQAWEFRFYSEISGKINWPIKLTFYKTRILDFIQIVLTQC
jgi:hypothetical protein